MPRINRQRSESGYYHIMIRGNIKKEMMILLWNYLQCVKQALEK